LELSQARASAAAYTAKLTPSAVSDGPIGVAVPTVGIEKSPGAGCCVSGPAPAPATCGATAGSAAAGEGLGTVAAEGGGGGTVVAEGGGEGTVAAAAGGVAAEGGRGGAAGGGRGTDWRGWPEEDIGSCIARITPAERRDDRDPAHRVEPLRPCVVFDWSRAGTECHAMSLRWNGHVHPSLRERAFSVAFRDVVRDHNTHR
jgi:hypothetical protein